MRIFLFCSRCQGQAASEYLLCLVALTGSLLILPDDVWIQLRQILFLRFAALSSALGQP